MATARRATKEWRDGFLFVGNHPALDLLNTKLIDSEGETVELLTHVAALGRWFVASGLVHSSRGKEFIRHWANDPRSTRFLQDLLAFRERLRAAAINIEGRKPPAKEFVAELNGLLQSYPTRTALVAKAGVLELVTVFEPAPPDDFWPLIAAVSAALLSGVPYSRIRKCETCIVHFYDVSKKSSRRWCSMSLCGNKVKVAAYQQRRRESAH